MPIGSTPPIGGVSGYGGYVIDSEGVYVSVGWAAAVGNMNEADMDAAWQNFVDILSAAGWTISIQKQWSGGAANITPTP